MSDSPDRSREPLDRFDWLDDDAAERLLLGEAADARAEPLTRLLAAAGTPAAVDPAREEAALAAFRAAGEEVPFVAGRGSRGRPRSSRRRGDGKRRVARSVRAIAGAMVVTAALGGVAVAAGALPSPFAGGTARPVPAHSVPGRSRRAVPRAGRAVPCRRPRHTPPTPWSCAGRIRQPKGAASVWTTAVTGSSNRRRATGGRYPATARGCWTGIESAAGRPRVRKAAAAGSRADRTGTPAASLPARAVGVTAGTARTAVPTRAAEVGAGSGGGAGRPRLRFSASVAGEPGEVVADRPEGRIPEKAGGVTNMHRVPAHGIGAVVHTPKEA